MMQFFQDDFDTKILGCNVFKLIVNGDADHQILENLIRDSEVELLCGFVKFSSSNISFFENHKFSLTSIRSTYTLSGKHKPRLGSLPEDFTIETGPQQPTDIEHSDIVEIAEVLGNTSRYFKDNQIPRTASLQLYITWIENSIFNEYADHSILLIKDKHLVGLHTMKVKEDTGIIDLIGLCNGFQKLGLGRTLLEKGIEWMKKRNVATIEVITEAENIAATAFYQRNGFIVKNTELVYHKHF